MPHVLMLNPSNGRNVKRAPTKKAKSKTAKRSVRKVAANPVIPVTKKTKRRAPIRAAKASRRRLHANPIKFPKPKTIISDQVIPAMQGAVGAVTISAINGMVIDRLPLPAQAKSGAIRDVLKGLSAVGIAAVAQGMGGKAKWTKNVAIGAMTMVMADATRRVMIKALPQVKLAGLEDELFNPLGYWQQTPMEQLVARTDRGGNDPALGFHQDFAGHDPLLAGGGEYDPASGEFEY